jgi:hypothetical protein
MVEFVVGDIRVKIHNIKDLKYILENELVDGVADLLFLLSEMSSIGTELDTDLPQEIFDALSNGDINLDDTGDRNNDNDDKRKLQGNR